MHYFPALFFQFLFQKIGLGFFAAAVDSFQYDKFSFHSFSFHKKDSFLFRNCLLHHELSFSFRVEGVHGVVYAVFQRRFNGIGGMNFGVFDSFYIFSIGTAEHVFYYGVSIFRVAHADAEAVEVLAAQMGDEGFDTVMSAGGTLLRILVFPGGRSRSSQMM